MLSRSALVVALALKAAPAVATERCTLPRAARTVLGILPHATSFAEAQLRFGKVPPHQAPEVAGRSLCYILEKGNDREYMLIVTSFVAGQGLVSMVRLSAEPPSGPLVGECRVAAPPPRAARSPIGRNVEEITRGLPTPTERSSNAIHYFKSWERTKRVSSDRTLTLNGSCRVSVYFEEGRVTAIESAWGEST